MKTSYRAFVRVKSVQVRIFLLFLLNFLSVQITTSQSLLHPPSTRQEIVKENYFGREITDPFRWIERSESAEVRSWREAQNEYARRLLDALPARRALEKRFKEIMGGERVGAPMEREEQFFFLKRSAGENQKVLYMREGMNGADQELLNPHSWSADHSLSIQLQDVTPDGKLLAYGIRRGGEDDIELHLFDVERRSDVKEKFRTGAYYGLVFSQNGKGLYYSFLHREQGPRLYYHTFGTNYQQDRMVFGEGIEAKDGLSIGASQNGDYLLITIERGWTRSEIYLYNTLTQQPPQPIAVELEGNFLPQMVGERLYLQTDWQAPKGRIVCVRKEKPSPTDWKEILPAGNDVLNQFSVIGNHLVVHALHQISSRLSIYSLEGTLEGEIPLPELCTVSQLYGCAKGSKVIYDVQSFIRPTTTYLYDFKEKKSTLWSKTDQPLESEQYQTQQVWFPSKDGTQVPMFIICKKGLRLDGNNPLLLYGYGGFNLSITPQFNPNSAVWLEQGGVYAVANIRGGGEMGKNWHEDGILHKKQNGFDDFISAAEWLIAQKYTAREKIAIQGESNGGLTVGVAFTQRPDLFRAVLCEFPVLDVIGYTRFPLYRTEMYEYGDVTKAEDFQYIAAYSPYQNVQREKNYPAILFITGDADERVPPWQARKMTALLQVSTSSVHPILLLDKRTAGHSAGNALSSYIELFSYKMAFLFWQLGCSYNHEK